MGQRNAFLVVMGLLAGVFAIAAGGCERKEPEDKPAPETKVEEKAEKPPVDAAVAQRGAQAVNQLAWGLWAKVDTDSERNLFFSPVSVSQAVSLCAMGTAGPTRNELLGVMGYTPGINGEQEQASLMGVLETAKSDQVSFDNANALWATQEDPLKADYVKKAQTLFAAQVSNVDFGKPAQAAKTINKWVEGRTRGKIKELIEPPMIQKDTRVVLTNAVYFKADWDWPFDAKDTKKEPFKRSGKAPVEAEMLKDTRWLRHAQDAGYSMVEIDYAGRRVMFRAILLRDDVAMKATRLDGARVEALAKKAEGGLVELTLPKFKIEWGEDLTESLKEMGIKHAFGRGDFTPMFVQNPKEGTYVSAVVHKAMIEVDEKGTVAAAATGMMAAPAAAPPPEPPKVFVFKADHPFVFQIVEKETGCVLFMGRVNDPR